MDSKLSLTDWKVRDMIAFYERVGELYMIQVLLKQNVEGLGKKGEIIDVKSGYARNYLIPEQLAFIASESEIEKSKKEAEKKTQRVEAESVKIDAVKKALAKKRISLHRRATDTGTLYAAVTRDEIRGALYKTYGAEVPEGAIQFDTIKSVGLYHFKIMFKNKDEVPMKIKIFPDTSHAPRDK